MADIELVSGDSFDGKLRLTDDRTRLTYLYMPRFLSRRAKRELRAAIGARREYLRSLMALDRDEMSDDEQEQMLRLTCDVISLVVTTTKPDTPRAGDLLYDGWAEGESVSDDQINALYASLFGLDQPDEEEGESPS